MKKSTPLKPKAKPDLAYDRRERLMAKDEVLEAIGCTYVHLWKMMVANDFPRARELGSAVAPGRGKCFWLASEVEQWIRDRPTKKLKGDPDEKDIITGE